MSLRLRLAVIGARLVGRPILSRVADPVRARRGLEAACRLLPRPPQLLHLVDAGAPGLHWISSRARRHDWAILYLHGGGYVAGSAATHLALCARLSRLTGLDVASPDYRLAPEHPFPAAFKDACAAHAAVLAKGIAADRIILAGDSAGGGLALALLADLCRRGMAPAGLFAFSPWTDLAMTGPSLAENAARDPLLPVHRMTEAVAMVRGGLELRDPRLSPLYAVFSAPPPVFLQVGTTEILRDDCRRMAEVLRRAGGEVTIEEWPDCPHVWQMLDGLVPEARAALGHVARFVARLVSAD